MLVVVQGEGELSGPERQLVRWLETWGIESRYGIGGVAVANCRIPHPKVGYRQVDLIIWTPFACVVVEVKGFKSPQSGTVEVSANSIWTIGGKPAALYGSKSDSNPVGQVDANVFAVKNHFRAFNISPDWVDGLVLLFPMPGEKLDLKACDSFSQQKHADAVNFREGTDVAVGLRTPLRRYLFDRRREQRETPLWSAQAVAKAFETLKMTAMSPSMEALVAEGFPRAIERPYRHRPYTPATAASPSTTSPTPTEADPIPIAQSAAQSVIPGPAQQQSPPVPQPLPAARPPFVDTPTFVGLRPIPVHPDWSMHPTQSPSWAPVPRAPSQPRRQIRVPRRLLKSALAILIAVASVKAASAVLADRFPETERFQSPSGNLVCEIIGETSKATGHVTCSAATYFYAPPPPPPDCPIGGFGHAIALTRAVGANFTCMPGPKKAGARVLSYGSFAALDSITCVSATDGITCNDDTGRGFRIERDAYNLW